MCPTPQAPLSASLSCGEAQPLRDLVEALAGRRLDRRRTDRIDAELKQLAGARPDLLPPLIAQAATTVAAWDAAPAFEVAEARSTLLWELLEGDSGPWPTADLPETTATLRAHAAVWAHDDTTRLMLTETDVEGWIHYVSLLREVQGAGPLTAAVADRVGLYRIIRERWQAVDRDGKIAFAVYGTAWPDARLRWIAADWEGQVAWTKTAPLPPAMTTNSAGYLEAVTAMDPVRHARALDNGLGPLRRRLP